MPSEVAERLEHEFDRLQFQCHDLDVKQGRHIMPIIFEYGLQVLEEMDAEAFQQVLDELGVPVDADD